MMGTCVLCGHILAGHIDGVCWTCDCDLNVDLKPEPPEGPTP